MTNSLRIILIAFALLAVGVTAEAQQAKKIWRVGYLSSGSPTSESARSEGIRLALRESGYLEGQNIAIEYRYAEGRQDRYPELVAELLRLKVDIILAAEGDLLQGAAKNATKRIPIIMIGAGSDPVEAGHVESLARPGGNVTGITNLARELGGKRIELLKEVVPKATRIAYLYDSTNPDSLREVKENLPAPARALGLTIQSWALQVTDDFDTVFAAISKQPPDALYMPAGPLIRSNQKRIVNFTLKSRLPSTGTMEYVDGGG